jgi:hypothetical protein
MLRIEFAPRINWQSAAGPRTDVAAVLVKCQVCGFEMTWVETSPTTGDVTRSGDQYAICHYLIAKIERGENDNLSMLDCYDLYQALAVAVAEYRGRPAALLPRTQ